MVDVNFLWRVDAKYYPSVLVSSWLLSISLQFRALAPMYYRGSAAAIIVYDITKEVKYTYFLLLVLFFFVFSLFFLYVNMNMCIKVKADKFRMCTSSLSFTCTVFTLLSCWINARLLAGWLPSHEWGLESKREGGESVQKPKQQVQILGSYSFL